MPLSSNQRTSPCKYNVARIIIELEKSFLETIDGSHGWKLYIDDIVTRERKKKDTGLRLRLEEENKEAFVATFNILSVCLSVWPAMAVV